MYKTDLVDYFNEKLDAQIFYNHIKDELDNYKNGLEKKGSSIPIRLDGDVDMFKISKSHLEKLNGDYSSNKVDCYFISYIADALLLSENSLFENDDLKDDFESLTEYPYK